MTEPLSALRVGGAKHFDDLDSKRVIAVIEMTLPDSAS